VAYAEKTPEPNDETMSIHKIRNENTMSGSLNKRGEGFRTFIKIVVGRVKK
jgi:hypothetical protein